MRPSGRQRRLVILTLAVLAFAIAFYGGSHYRNRDKVPPAIAGVSIYPPSPLPEPEGPAQTEPLLDKAALTDHWSLLMLDPHHAEDRSPALVRLLQIHNRLAAEPEIQKNLRYLYLPRSSEPQTLEAIARLGDHINPVPVPPERVDETFQRFGVDPNGNDAALYLIGPEVRLHALFTRGEDAANIAKDLIALINTDR